MKHQDRLERLRMLDPEFQRRQRQQEEEEQQRLAELELQFQKQQEELFKSFIQQYKLSKEVTTNKVASERELQRIPGLLRCLFKHIDRLRRCRQFLFDLLDNGIVPYGLEIYLDVQDC